MSTAATHLGEARVVAVIGIGFIAYCLWAREIPLRFGEPVTRGARPFAYWGLLALMGALVALLCAAHVRA